MKRFSLLFAAAILLIAFSMSNVALAQTDDVTTPAQHGPHFIDENGDGYNDNAPDNDGDGIPNGQDADYAGPGKSNHPPFVDEDGDGINDNAGSGRGIGGQRGGQAQGTRPQDGTGLKKGHGGGNGSGVGSGDCTGDGPKGFGRGRK